MPYHTTHPNCNRRITMSFEKQKSVVNFFVYYEVDDNLSQHVLTLDWYGGDAPDCWVLLEEEEPVEAPSEAPSHALGEVEAEVAA